MNLINANLQKIIELCRKHKVKTLSVFGSILTDSFNDESDVDLLVDFEPYDPDSMEFDCLGNYIEMVESLEEIFGRKVDLVVQKSMKNKYLIANIKRTLLPIYG